LLLWLRQNTRLFDLHVAADTLTSWQLEHGQVAGGWMQEMNVLGSGRFLPLTNAEEGFRHLVVSVICACGATTLLMPSLMSFVQTQLGVL
jgi:hypothetical protein